MENPEHLPTIVLICEFVSIVIVMFGLMFLRYHQRRRCLINTMTESYEDGDVLTIPPETRCLIPESFHGIKVTADDSHITDIAHDLCHSDKVCAFFKYLGIRESRYVPQFEHWFRNECDTGKYRQIMLDVLVHWCRKECPNATLYKLVDALMNATLTHISSSSINKYRDEVNTEFLNDDYCHEDADGSLFQTDIASKDMLELRHDDVYSYTDGSSLPVEYCDTCNVHIVVDAACSPDCLIILIAVLFLMYTLR